MEPGVCKIVVATNIAETSITVSDVTHVIDAGREKQMAFDPHTHMTSLREVWVSQASAQQRAGRAGRVRPGICYRLYEQAFLEHEMLPHTLPEIRRVTLEDLILTVLLLELGSPQAFLQRAIEPPSSKAVAASLKVLLDIEAVSLGPKDENGGNTVLLKPLGFHLASLPVDCRMGKMLVIASLFDCLDPILTIAAAFSGKSPFYAPVGKREEAQLAKEQFANSKSDHLALVAMWKAWSHVKDGPWAAKKDFARRNFVSISALENMEAVRNQLVDHLVKCGFVVPVSSFTSFSTSKRSGPAAAAAAAAVGPPETINYNANEYDERLLKCVLLSGLTPQIVKLVRPTRGKGAHFVSKNPTVNVAIHPSSVNAKRIQQAGPEGREALAIYHRKMQTTRTYLHDVSFVSPLSVLLFASNVRVRREHGGVASKVVNIVVDDWLSFKSKEETSVLLTVFKKHLDTCLLLKITRPDSDLVSRFHPLVKTLRQLLMIEAMGASYFRR
jgi:ATP-dependent RNA helicase DHX57